MPTDEPTGTSRRDLLKLIGLTAGSAALYQAMTSLGYAAESGYKVKVLEFNNRAGGRNWSLRGGDSYTELGGATQK